MLKALGRPGPSYFKSPPVLSQIMSAEEAKVEAKPEVSTLERFGPNGDVILCDWEMVFAGPIGRDIGLAWVSQAFRLSEYFLST
mgnify:CR=1 FL=1